MNIQKLLLKWLYNRLHRVNTRAAGCTTGCTTGCIV